MMCLQLIRAHWAGNEWSVKSDLRCFLFFENLIEIGRYIFTSLDWTVLEHFATLPSGTGRPSENGVVANTEKT